jgi:hypothetical protein
MAGNRAVLLQTTVLLALKLILAPLAVWLASLASKRYGHVIGGILSGFPMIAAPVTAALLIDHPATHVASIAFATVGGLVATLGFITAFAWAAKANQPWWVCLGAAALAFVAIGASITVLKMPTELSVALGFCAPLIARGLLPKLPAPKEVVTIPKAELTLRLGGAFVLAALLLFSAGNTQPWLSGLLIAWPITGSILPCFTQRLSGANATVAFFSGFSRGLVGLAVFFCCLGLTLPLVEKFTAYTFAIVCAALVAIWLARTAKGK